MKILVVPTDPLSAYVKQGNLEQFMDRLVFYSDNGAQVVILNIDPSGASFRDGRIKILNISMPSLKILYAFRLFFQVIKKSRSEKADVIRVFEGGSFLRAAICGVAAKIAGKKCFVSLHGHYKGFASSYGHKKIALPFLWLLEAIAKSCCDSFIVISDSEKKLFAREVEIVPNYVDTDLFKPTGQKKEYDAIYVGSLTKRKGIDELAEISIAVRKKFPNFILAVAGSGPLESLLKGAPVKIIGPIDNKKLFLEYSKAKIFVTASFHEGFGIPLAEAQSCALPVVARNLKAFQEVTVPGKTSILVDNGKGGIAEAIITLLSDEKKAREMGQAGREFVKQNFERKKILAREYELIGALAQKSGRK